MASNPSFQFQRGLPDDGVNENETLNDQTSTTLKASPSLDLPVETEIESPSEDTIDQGEPDQSAEEVARAQMEKYDNHFLGAMDSKTQDFQARVAAGDMSPQDYFFATNRLYSPPAVPDAEQQPLIMGQPTPQAFGMNAQQTTVNPSDFTPASANVSQQQPLVASANPTAQVTPQLATPNALKPVTTTAPSAPMKRMGQPFAA